MKQSPFNKRIEALRQFLEGPETEHCDTLWILQPENRRYLSGFRAGDPQLTESSGSLLINRNRCVLITDSRYTLEAQREAQGFELHTFREDLAEGLSTVLGSLGCRKLGFEADFVTWGLHRRVSDRLGELSPPVDLVPLEGLIEGMREVKDDSEISALEDSAMLMSRVLDEVIRGLKPGLMEREVAWQIEALVREAGAEGVAFPLIVASGPNGALPHAVPTDRRLAVGEPLILDVGARLEGYCSDMTRTVFLEDPDPQFRSVYRTVREAQLRALDQIRPGVESTHVDGIARQCIEEAGFGEYFGHALGHGVGLATHERPRLGPRRPVFLQAGMVVTVEPGIYIPGKGGVRLEEMVVVEPAGAGILTKNGWFYDFPP